MLIFIRNKKQEMEDALMQHRRKEQATDINVAK